jgi:hypothetical protein
MRRFGPANEELEVLFAIAAMIFVEGHSVLLGGTD